MTNRDVYTKDPRTTTLLNQGVAKVSGGQTDTELETLRYEVENFVCDGQYEQGLDRILSTYLGHLDKTEQPGVWVSGFYGSGKSHLVKMLQYLWADYEFKKDGAKARGLAKLPTRIKELLKELSTHAKRAGGLHAAAGELKYRSDRSIRLEVLGIVAKSAGLPEDYARAGFVLWLRHEGIEEPVRKAVTAAGKDFDFELENLYVSDPIPRAVLAARPDFAKSPADARLLIEKQFPERSDVSDDDLISRLRQTVAGKGKLPCTLVVLDEVQQYIGDSPDRSKAVQEVQQVCCARLGPQFMLVGTGQNALSGTPQLQRLQGRFPVTVELQDTDVEKVTREVVLKKRASAEDPLKALLEKHSSEIERQLSATKIGFSTRDRGLLVQDYPILPVRRRFWERVIRAVDKAGTGAQLRTQLWVVHEAAKQTAHLPLGNVVSGAFVYDASVKSMTLKSGTLLQEISETIERQKQEPQHGDLRYGLCALIFLIGQFSREGPADIGIRANAETLADLLVTDLTRSSGELRKTVADLLDQLVAAGAVMRVEDEYRMQTREGSEWNQAYQEAKNRLLADPGKLAAERSQLLKTHAGEVLKKSKLPHGVSKEPRKIEPHFGADPPPSNGAGVPVWLRDEWEVNDKVVLNDARAAGDAATVFAFVPQSARADALRKEIASHYAATAALQAKGVPNTREGEDARRAMETLRDMAERARDALIVEILNEAAVYVAGGDQIAGVLLEKKVQDAARACLDRMYPLFHLADLPAADWEKVFDQAKKKNPDALAAVGHKGDPDTHPVCKAVLDFVGTSKKGTDIRRHFGGDKYGWPQDAIDAALAVLHQSGAVQARAGAEPVAPGKLDKKTIAAAEFRAETVTLSTVQLIEVRKLFPKVGLNPQPGQESANVPEFLVRLNRLADEAGGDPPLPARPTTAHLSDIAGKVGNEQLKAIHEKRKQIAEEISEWAGRKEVIAQRKARWDDLKALLAHAAGLPVEVEVQAEVNVVEANRRLLTDPDPTPGLADRLTQSLRDELNRLHVACSMASMVGMQALKENVAWNKLDPEQRQGLLTHHQLTAVPSVEVGSTTEVLATLQRMKLGEWRTLCDALPTRFTHALAEAAKLLEPKAQHVKLPTVTIKDVGELKAWLADLESTLTERLKDGPVIL